MDPRGLLDFLERLYDYHTCVDIFLLIDHFIKQNPIPFNRVSLGNMEKTGNKEIKDQR